MHYIQINVNHRTETISITLTILIAKYSLKYEKLIIYIEQFWPVL